MKKSILFSILLACFIKANSQVEITKVELPYFSSFSTSCNYVIPDGCYIEYADRGYSFYRDNQYVAVNYAMNLYFSKAMEGYQDIYSVSFDESEFFPCFIKFKFFLEGSSFTNASWSQNDQYIFPFGNRWCCIVSDNYMSNFGSVAESEPANLRMIDINTGETIYEFGNINLYGINIKGTHNGRSTYYEMGTSEIVIELVGIQTKYPSRVNVTRYLFKDPNSVSAINEVKNAPKISVSRLDNVIKADVPDGSSVSIYNSKGVLLDRISNTSGAVSLDGGNDSPIIYKVSTREKANLTGKIK